MGEQDSVPEAPDKEYACYVEELPYVSIISTADLNGNSNSKGLGFSHNLIVDCEVKWT